MHPPGGDGSDPATRYPQEELASAFDRVMTSRDWQAPIRSIINAADRHVVEAAVRRFTETVPSFAAVPGDPGRLCISADGYRLGLEKQ